MNNRLHVDLFLYMYVYALNHKIHVKTSVLYMFAFILIEVAYILIVF